MAAANLVTSQVAKRYDALPVGFVGERALLVAMADPANVHAIDDIAILTGYEIRVAVATSEDLAYGDRAPRASGDVVRAGLDDAEAEAAEDAASSRRAARHRPTTPPSCELVHQLVGQAVEAGRLGPAHHPRGP